MNNLVIQDNDMKMFQIIAQSAAKSGLYKNAGGVDAIFMVLLAAHDLGIKPTIALNGGIWNIQGKIEISARLMTSMIRRAGHSLTIKESSATTCTILGKRCDNSDEHEVTFTIEHAQKAGLAGRDVWKKYPEDMLYARCLSRLARRLYPDIIGVAYVEGEIRDEQIKPENLQPSDVEVSDLPDENPIQKVPSQIKHQIEQPVVEELTLEERKAMNALADKCDPEYINKVFERLSQKGINGFEGIKKDLYELIMAGMVANSRKYQGLKSA